MTVNERIMGLIKEKGIRQVTLAEAIGIRTSSMSTICNGKNNPSRQTVKLIAQYFDVNETWLLTGEGDKYGKPTREQEIADIVISELNDTSYDQMTKNSLIKIISKLSSEELRIIRDMAVKLVESLK